MNNSSKDEDVGLTMEQLEHIQIKMQIYCRQQNINMKYVFTDEEEQAGKDIAAFIEALDTIGLGLGVLEGFEMVGLLKLLDTKNDGVINVAQFISFLMMESENVVEEDNFSYGTKKANLPATKTTQRKKLHDNLLDNNVYNTKKAQIVNNYFQQHRRAFYNLYKSFANTNSAQPWIDYSRWINFSRNCGLITGHLSRRQIESLFKDTSATAASGRINFQVFLELLVMCSETMTGPYPYVEERLAFLFNRFGERGHAVPGANVLLSRVLQTKAIVAVILEHPIHEGRNAKTTRKN